MKKEEFVELVRKRLPEQSEVHFRTIELSIASLFSDMIFSKFKKGEVDQFAKTYEGVKVNNVDGKYHCDLPVKITASPNGMGSVRRVFPSEEDDIMFLAIHPVRVRLIKHDDIQAVSNIIPYYLKNGNTIVFHTKNMQGVTEVDMNIVPDFTEYEMEEHIMMPGGMEFKIVQLIAEMFVGTPQKDKYND